MKIRTSTSQRRSILHRQSRSIRSRHIAPVSRIATSIIFDNLGLEDIVTFRGSSSRIKSHVDDHIRRKFIAWRPTVRTQTDDFSHERILLICIEQFTKLRFRPPYILKLINKTQSIAATYDDLWHEFLAPIKIDDREKLLRAFYDETSRCLSEKEKKVAFLLTMLQMLKVLSDSKFRAVQPFNRKANFRLEFKIQNLFFAIPYYNFGFNWFSFNQDWIQMLLLLTKFLEIKAALSRIKDVAWVKYLRPMKFENASVFFAMKNSFTKRTKTPSKVEGRCFIQADRKMITNIKNFMKTENFDWEKIAKEFKIQFKLECVRGKICKSKSRILRLQIIIENFLSWMSIKLVHQF